MIRPKLDELVAEIESFIDEVTAEVDGVFVEVESFAPDVVAPLKGTTAKVGSIKVEVKQNLVALEGEIDAFVQ